MRVSVPNFAVDRHVPSLVRPLHCNNAPGDDVEKRESHRCLSVAFGIHQKNGEGRNVACAVLLRGQQLDESGEAALDAASGGGGAAHVCIIADKHDSGADLKVVVDALDQLTKQVPAVNGGSEVTARVGLKFAVDGSYQLLQKAVQLACDGICGAGVVRTGRVAGVHDGAQQLLEQWRQAGQDCLQVPWVAVFVRSAGRLGCWCF